MISSNNMENEKKCECGKPLCEKCECCCNKDKCQKCCECGDGCSCDCKEKSQENN